MKAIRTVLVGITGVAYGWMIVAAPAAKADDASYLASLHGNSAVAGFSDFALLIGGHKACALPPDQMAAVAPGMPAVSSAVYDAAHRELCP